MKTVLQGVGHRLTELKLSDWWGEDIEDIITLCPSLTDLSLIRCTSLYSHRQTPLDPQLPHFRNVINLNIYHVYKYLSHYSYLPYYVSVKTVDVTLKVDFDQFVREILNLGTYKQLEVLRVEQTPPHLITKKALELLIGHCPLLKRIELVGTTGDSVEHDFGELKRQMLLQNFDLKFKHITLPH
jgi:hypothetical protein